MQSNTQLPTHWQYIYDVEGPPNTKKVHREYAGGCCGGHQETWFELDNGLKHGPHVWEYGGERIVKYYDNGKLLRTETYIQDKNSNFVLVKSKI